MSNNRNEKPADNKQDDKAGIESAAEMARKYKPEELDQIANHALPIYMSLITGELRSRSQEHVAHVAFARASGFVDTLNKFKELGEIPAVPPKKAAAVTLPNMDKNPQALKAHQRAMHQYVKEGEPGPERMLKIREQHGLPN